LGINKAEGELSLPTNSLLYYVQNTEKKGIESRDAFFQSIGQAKIEEEFRMPAYYFQGPVFKFPNMPDYKHDTGALMEFFGYKKTDPNF
jgi:hypothetical protein